MAKLPEITCQPEPFLPPFERAKQVLYRSHARGPLRSIPCQAASVDHGTALMRDGL